MFTLFNNSVDESYIESEICRRRDIEKNETIVKNKWAAKSWNENKGNDQGCPYRKKQYWSIWNGRRLYHNTWSKQLH